MNRLSLVLFAFLLAPAVSAQISPIPVLDRMEAQNERWWDGVQDFTRVEKNVLASVMPAVQFFERVSDDSEQGMAAFRMVPPDELADSAAARSGQATAAQRAEGMADAIPEVLGGLGRLAEQYDVNVPDEIETRVGAVAMGADIALRGIAAGNSMDTQSDALDHLRDLDLIRQYPSSARLSEVRGHSAFLIETTGLERVPTFDASGVDGISSFTLKQVRRWVDRTRLVTLKLEVTIEVTTEDQQTGSLVIEREDFAFETFGPTGLLVPTCTTGSIIANGDRENAQTASYMRRYMEMNQGPPSNERQHQLMAEALDDFEYYNNCE